MKTKYLILLLLFTFYRVYPQSKLYKIDPGNFLDNKITLAEIADDITYVPLDNRFPIGITYKLKITNDYIYLSAKDVGILKFDRSGKLVCKIGSLGRGPGEYLHFMDYAVDEKTGNVFVMGPGIIKGYSKNGFFIRDIIYKEYIGFVGGDIEIYNSKLFIPDYLITGDSKNSWIFLDTLGNLVTKKKNSVPPFKSNTGIEGSIYKFGDKFYYYNLYNDTIFSISPDLSNQGAYLFSKGDHRWPIGKVKTDDESWKKLFKPVKMFETKYFIALIYADFDRAAICLIDKKTKKTFLAFKKTGSGYSTPCLINDLDGGIPFSISINCYAENNEEYFIELINPFDLKTYLSTDEFRNTVPKNPQKKKELEKLAASLNETDNPILMMARLKK